MTTSHEGISLADLYLAYRKAKADAYYESSHFHALAFLAYEKDLEKNLKRLEKRLAASTSLWSNPSDIGSYSYLPKSVEQEQTGQKADGVFFKCLDPTEEWNRLWSNLNRAKAKFRMVISPTVDFQVFSALWIIKAGHVFDQILDPDTSFGHRLRRSGEPEDLLFDNRKPLNLDCVGLFEPYFSAYREWRKRGLDAMRSHLQQGERVFGVTMDIQSFYHRANGNFLLREAFLERFSIELSPLQAKLTQLMVEAINTWYSASPDAEIRPSGGLPVGLSASKVIANVLLAELDQKMVETLKPMYYGRYVDDIFLVVKGDHEIRDGTQMMKWLSESVGDLLEFEPATEFNNDQLRLHLPYADDAELIFAGDKQKVFNLMGPHGIDLVSQIELQIRLHSSEHRLLSIVPGSGEEMAARTLLAQSDAALESDALRKADVVSVRRLGLALLLRDMEAYARDLRASEWKKARIEFYGLVHRHLLTPTGFFDFSGHLPRVLGLMVSCGDYESAQALIEKIIENSRLLEDTTTAGTIDRDAYGKCLAQIKRALTQATAQATTVAHFRWSKELLSLSRALDRLHPLHPLPKSLDPLKRLSKQMLYADLGRRPYRELWLAGVSRAQPNPSVPKNITIRRLLRLGAIRAFREAANLRVPYWPALVFPTRPINLSEITKAAPTLLQQPRELRAALFAMRGSKARNHEGVIMLPPSSDRVPTLQVDGPFKKRFRFAIPSFLTTDTEWLAAIGGKPKLTLERYERIRKLINGIMQEDPIVDYIVFPECSIPYQWVHSLARKLAEKGISFIGGLEYQLTDEGVRNDAFLSIATNWPWHKTSVIYIQSKFAPAHEERRVLATQRKRLFTPPVSERTPTIIQHENFSFAVLICSDLTNISHRYRLQGKIDSLIVVEWNKDTETFSSLVEATANDLHAYIVQSNNRQYGDSRVRAPRKQNHERDIVRVRGGSHDYFVVAELDVDALRTFQLTTPTTSQGPFKPTPIGFRISVERGGSERPKKSSAKAK